MHSTHAGVLMEAVSPAGVLTTATSSPLAQGIVRLTRAELANRRVSFRVSALDRCVCVCDQCPLLGWPLLLQPAPFACSMPCGRGEGSAMTTNMQAVDWS